MVRGNAQELYQPSGNIGKEDRVLSDDLRGGRMLCNLRGIGYYRPANRKA